MADPVTLQQLINAGLDADTLAEVTMSDGYTADTTTNRDAVVIDTIEGRLKKLGYDVPIPYAGGIVYAVGDRTKTVEESGVVYAPLPSSLPFTTDGIFANDAAKFFTVQITEESLNQLIREVSLTEELARVVTAADLGNIYNTSEYASGSGAGGGKYELVNANPGFPLINPQKTDGSLYWLKLVNVGKEFDVAYAGVDSSESTAAIQEVFDYCASKGFTATGNGSSIINAQLLATGINVDFSTFKLTLANSFPDSEAILFSGASQGNPRIGNFVIDGNRANQGGTIAAVSIEAISNAMSRYSINGTECGVVAQFKDSTEKFIAEVGAVDSDLAVYLTDGSSGGDDSPDESIITVTGSNCKKYLKYDGGGSGRVVFGVEQQDGTDPAIEILGTKMIQLAGEVRAINNPLFINAPTCQVDFSGLIFVNCDTAGAIIQSAQTVSGYLSIFGTNIDHLAIEELGEGGVLSLTTKGVSTSYAIKLGSFADSRTCQRLILNHYTTGDLLFDLASECQVNCSISPTSITFSNPNTQGNHVTVPRNFIINDNALTQTGTQDNSVDVVGNLSSAQILAYTTPARGLKCMHDRTQQSRMTIYTATGASGWQTTTMTDVV